MTFQKGHKFSGGIGSRGQTKPNFLTQQLISQLNEIDKAYSKKCGMPKLRYDRLVDKMIDLAVKGDRWMIAEIFNRVQGKAPQQLELTQNVQISRIVREIVDPANNTKTIEHRPQNGPRQITVIDGGEDKAA